MGSRGRKAFWGGGAVVLAAGIWLATTGFRFAPGVAVRDATCDGAPCSIRAFRGPEGRLLLRLDEIAYTVDFEAREANETWTQALRPVPLGALYDAKIMGRAREMARTKYIGVKNFAFDGRTLSFEDLHRGTVALTLEG